AIELKPQVAKFFYSRGLIHAEFSEPDIAITDLETALELGLAPDDEQDVREVLYDLNAQPQPDPNAMVEAGLITFASDRDGALGIYVMNADGTSDANVLTIHPYYENWPAWSPSGDQIAFASYRNDENFEIYVINADGSGLTRLTDNPGMDGVPDWSPDSEQIAYTSERDGNSEIFVMNADGSGVRRLTNNPALDGHPSWSHDGSQIAFESDRDGDAEIFLMNADGGNITQLTENTTIDAGPAWSPDGSRIAFLSVRDGNVDIYVMDKDGSNVTRLTKDPADDLYQTWSPDGQLIAFTSNRDNNYEIYVMKADGSGLTRLTDNTAAESYPSWSPPGEILSTDPWFGPPWCTRDTDGDMEPDTPTSTFITDDIFAYIMFPFRNMEDGMEWSHKWAPENGMSMNNLGWWDGGEAGFHVAMFSAPSWGSGKLTIQLFIEDKMVQEIECAVVEP
ncbi:MAG: PD40 domain-containing protein, partial [Anaerolineales bacterium]|nr:PD40 domain-containing protein [Anaerolineales bacterium]